MGLFGLEGICIHAGKYVRGSDPKFNLHFIPILYEQLEDHFIHLFLVNPWLYSSVDSHVWSDMEFSLCSVTMMLRFQSSWTVCFLIQGTQSTIDFYLFFFSTKLYHGWDQLPDNNQPKRGRIYSGFQCESSGPCGREGMAVEKAWAAGAACSCSSRKETARSHLGGKGREGQAVGLGCKPQCLLSQQPSFSI